MTTPPLRNAAARLFPGHDERYLESPTAWVIPYLVRSLVAKVETVEEVVDARRASDSRRMRGALSALIQPCTTAGDSS